MWLRYSLLLLILLICRRVMTSVKFVPGVMRKRRIKLSCLVDNLIAQHKKINAVILISWILNIGEKTAQGS